MKVNLYELLQDQIEAGLLHGLRRAYKYDAAPKTEEEMQNASEQILNEIMNAVCTYITFDHHGDEG